MKSAKESEKRRSPVIFGREAETKQFKHTLQNFSTKKSLQRVVNYQGAPGVGKTELIFHFEDIAKKQGYQTVVLSFSKDRPVNPKAIINSIRKQLNLKGHTSKSQTIIDEVREILQQNELVILVDSPENIVDGPDDYYTRSWLEDELARVINSDRALLVSASKHDNVWSTVDLRSWRNNKPPEKIDLLDRKIR